MRKRRTHLLNFFHEGLADQPPNFNLGIFKQGLDSIHWWFKVMESEC